MKISNRRSQISNSMQVMLLMIAIAVFLSQKATAQGLPTTLKGDAGLQSGTQPPPGLYITNLAFNYNFGTLVTNDGRKIEGSGSINQTFHGLAVTYVSEKKILGGHYSASAVILPLISVAIDTPRLDLKSRFTTSDMFFQPIQLGWGFKQLNLVAGYGLFVPTGRFSPTDEFVSIDARGHVAQCDCWVTSYPDYWFGNIFDNVSFTELMQSCRARQKFQARPEALMRDESCVGCDYLLICHGGCPVRTYSITGEFFRKDPYCQVYKAMFSTMEEMAARTAASRSRRALPVLRAHGLPAHN